MHAADRIVVLRARYRAEDDEAGFGTAAGQPDLLHHGGMRHLAGEHLAQEVDAAHRGQHVRRRQAEGDLRRSIVHCASETPRTSYSAKAEYPVTCIVSDCFHIASVYWIVRLRGR